MSYFWCWLFGHKWRNVDEWVNQKTSFKFIFFCERCGKTEGKIDNK